jgi:hypothetical protein
MNEKTECHVVGDEFHDKTPHEWAGIRAHVATHMRPGGLAPLTPASCRSAFGAEANMGQVFKVDWIGRK